MQDRSGSYLKVVLKEVEHATVLVIVDALGLFDGPRWIDRLDLLVLVVISVLINRYQLVDHVSRDNTDL